jgi:DNA-binding beta-propeller fold protein YncE
MKRTLSVFVAAALTLGASLAAQTMVREIPFDTSTDILRTPADVYIGEVGGVGTNSRGHIFVYTRTGHSYATLGDNRTFYRGGSRLFEFDENGTFVRELGQDVYGFNAAIGLRVDAMDNVWTIDQGANQVVKFDPDGNIALVLGRKPEAIAVRPLPPRGGGPGRGGQQALPGSGTPGSSLSMPTDVAWDRQGNIYIADGIGSNNRILKLDRDGRFIKHWGSTGSQPGQFMGVKGVAIDAQGNVYAADTGNKRIQVFDGEGTFKSEFGTVGTPLAICITPGPAQFLYVSHSGDPDGMEDAAIYKVQLDGRVVGRFGSAGKLPKEFGLANSLDCRSENELLVGEMTNWRVQRVRLRP